MVLGVVSMGMIRRGLCVVCVCGSVDGCARGGSRCRGRTESVLGKILGVVGVEGGVEVCVCVYHR